MIDIKFILEMVKDKETIWTKNYNDDDRYIYDSICLGTIDMITPLMKRDREFYLEILEIELDNMKMWLEYQDNCVLVCRFPQ